MLGKGSAEEVPAADNHRDLNARVGDSQHLVSDVLKRRGIKTNRLRIRKARRRSA